VTPWVVILSAPSGGGKTAVTRALLERYPTRFGYSVSATTRRPRPGERDGAAYHFLTREDFERRKAAGEFLEFAQYAGELYGTLRSEVQDILARGLNALLDIEVKGARQVRAVYGARSISIFLVPPSARVLLNRLRARRTESRSEMARRVQIAVEEVRVASQDIQAAVVYDHVVLNDDLEQALGRVVAIVDRPSEVTHRTQDMVDRMTALERDLEREAHHLQAGL
jgi:guanylate kinase